MAYRVLVIEDNESLANLYRVWLEMSGLLVCLVGTAKMAIEWLRQPDKPELIILDLTLPDSDSEGITLCQNIKNNPLTMKIPIIVITGRVENEDKIKTKKAGADLYLTKPVSEEDFLKAVQQFLSRPEAVKQRRNPIVLKGLEINPEDRTLFYNGKTAVLNQERFDLFYTLAEGYPNAVDRRYLVEQDSPKNTVRDRELDVRICRLRRYLKKELGSKLIATEPGVGYRLVIPSSKPPVKTTGTGGD